MEHVEKAITFTLGGRQLRLFFNARALRLIKEHTGISILSGRFEGLSFAENIARVLWAITQNVGNGEPAQWPTFDWVEEHMGLGDLSRIAEVLGQLMPASATGEAASPASTDAPPNGQAALGATVPTEPPNPTPTGSNSGPSELLT